MQTRPLQRLSQDLQGEPLIKRQPFNSDEARAAAAANPFFVFNLASRASPKPEINDLNEADDQVAPVKPSASVQDEKHIIKKTVKVYTPREGSKAAAAIQALTDGPLTTAALAGAMDCPAANVKNNIAVAVRAGVIVKILDDQGVIHYALNGTSLDASTWPHVSGSRAKGLSAPSGPVKNKKKAKAPAVAKKAAKKIAAKPRALLKMPAQVEDFSCGIFSNGDFVIKQRDEVMILNVEETRAMMAYLDRMAVSKGAQA